MDFVGSRPFRSKLDLSHRYHNIRIHAESVKDSTFGCHMGKFDSLGMQQVDCNGHATMIRDMNFRFRNITDVKIYLHDILMAKHTYTEHIKTIRGVMKIAKDNELWFNEDKCQ